MRTSLRRASAATTGLLLTAATLVMAPASPAEPTPDTVEGATFTWGLSGYAQKGIFGSWSFKDLDGNVTQLVGSVSGGDQSEYLVDAVPKTSMPTGVGTPNAVKFSDGTGEVDPSGTSTLQWDGTYTVNAYPAQFGAPDEIYANPELTVKADGSGKVTMDVTIGAGQDQAGNPMPEKPLGRVAVMTFDAGSVDDPTSASYRVAPDYQGVTVNPGDGGTQERNCSTDGGATGWWGSWPKQYVRALPAAVRSHFYSTGCGGLQDNKPPLPFDVSLGEQSSAAPSVTVSDTTLSKTGKHRITVTGKGFDPSAATGTRPPLAGKAAGAYIVFGRFAKTWRPSKGAPSDARPIGSNKWAVLAEDMATIGGTEAGAVELKPDGSFKATLTVSKKLADDAASGTGRYGIYTYAGSGAAEPSYETATRIRFTKAKSTLRVVLPKKRAYGKAARAKVRVNATGGRATRAAGIVRAREGGKTLAKARLRNGRTTIRLPRRLAVGKHRIRFVYAGGTTVGKASARRPLRVRKAGSKVHAKVRTKRVTPRKRAVVAVKVRSRIGGVRVRGAVRVFDGKRVLKKRVRIGARGNARVRLPRLRVGKHALRVRYLGSATHKPSVKRVHFRVRR